MDDSFERLMNDAFGGSGIFGDSTSPKKPSKPLAKGEERGVPWQAKIIDDKYYIPLEQVADLLDENYILPKVAKGIRRRVEGLALRVKDRGSDEGR